MSDEAGPRDSSAGAAVEQPVPPPGLAGTRFRERSLRGARFDSCDLSEVVIRGSDVTNLEVDSPWLGEGDGVLLVNGVDVIALVDAELNKRFPGRELRLADDPAGLVAAWAAIESTWAATLTRGLAMGEEAITTGVDGEWSLVQTLRHLVLATDVWLGRAVLGLEQPYHPAGLPPDDAEGSAAFDLSVFSATEPTLAEVLAARADRQAMVRRYIAGVTAHELAEPRPNPHAPQHPETVLSCLGTILAEEWEHHRYIVRDLG